MTRLADYVFQFLATKGVKAVFLVPGGGSMYLVDAVGQNPDIEFIPTHHEQAASIAAEAYSRINGRLGCALVTTGPGSTNAITGVAGAWIESVPLVLISGQVKRADMMQKSGVRQKGPQEVDIVSLVTPITKYAVTVLNAADIRYHLERAIHVATTGRRGPVWLDIPLDIQASQIEPMSLRGFVGLAQDEPDRNALQNDVERVIELINQAQRPILLAGHGVRLADAVDEFRVLYERLEIPVATTWNAMDLIPSTNRLSVGKPGTVALRGANFAIQNSDLIFVIGARLDNVVTAYNPAKFGRCAPKILVDVDPAELRKFSSDMTIARAIQSDAKAFIQAMLSSTEPGRLVRVNRSAWLEKCEKWKARYSINDGRPFPSAGAISHYHITKVLSEEVPEDTLVVTGSSGLAVEIFYTGFQNRSGQRVLLTAGLGAMGYGLPAMIGASIAHGRRPFVGIEGDGSLMMNLQELATVKQLGLPLRLFVLNNSGYASIRNTQRNYFDGRFVGTGPEARLGFPDFVSLAEAFGIHAIRIDSAGELRKKIRQALEHDGPLLVDVRVQKDEALWPKSAALPQPDGSIISMPLEDMSPLLPRDEFRENMIVPLDPASEQVPSRLFEKSGLKH
jgi:acetolactate synthase-1/2/3 large subunit